MARNRHTSRRAGRWAGIVVTLGLATGVLASVPAQADTQFPADFTYCRTSGIVTLSPPGYLVGGPGNILGTPPPRPVTTFFTSKIVCTGTFVGQSDLSTEGFNACNAETEPQGTHCRRNPLYSTLWQTVTGSPSPPNSPLNFAAQESFSDGKVEIGVGLVHGLDTGIGCTLADYGWVWVAVGYLPVQGTCTNGTTYTSPVMAGYSTSEAPVLLFAGAGDAFARQADACLGDANPTCFNAVAFSGTIQFSSPGTVVPPVN